MKNFKKTISLILAICMIASLAISASAANTVDASGGTGTSSVTLSSTADGSIGGDPAATKMSVTTMPQHGASCSSASRTNLRKHFMCRVIASTGTQLTTMRIRTRIFT